MGRTCLLSVECPPDMWQQVPWLTRLVLDEVRHLRCERRALKHLCGGWRLFGIDSLASRNEIPGSFRYERPILLC